MRQIRSVECDDCVGRWPGKRWRNLAVVYVVANEPTQRPNTAIPHTNQSNSRTIKQSKNQEENVSGPKTCVVVDQNEFECRPPQFQCQCRNRIDPDVVYGDDI
jgi:hypothetical protein